MWPTSTSKNLSQMHTIISHFSIINHSSNSSESGIILVIYLGMSTRLKLIYILLFILSNLSISIKPCLIPHLWLNDFEWHSGVNNRKPFKLERRSLERNSAQMNIINIMVNTVPADWQDMPTSSLILHEVALWSEVPVGARPDTSVKLWCKLRANPDNHHQHELFYSLAIHTHTKLKNCKQLYHLHLFIL